MQVEEKHGNEKGKRQSYEYVILCDNNKKNREDWIINTKDKFQAIANNRNTVLYKSKIEEEMEKDVETYFKKKVAFKLTNN